MKEESDKIFLDAGPNVHSPRRGGLWLSALKGFALHGLAFVGLTHVASSVWKSHGVLPFQPELTSSVSNYDIHPDTDYPLRPAKEPWDISTSFPYPRNLSTSVSEGTWLRIATHPHKSEIVFDMLGDLYCMSTASNSYANGDSGADPRAAHVILDGIPYDKEVEFSNSGDQLVFISDAGYGVDNIWTMPYTSCADMAKQSQQTARASTVQQTNSTFRFYSSPAFHPEGEKIIATKWFLTGRPNGAGEIWEFPLVKNTQHLPEIAGKRIIQRKLPASWPRDKYGESQLGVEQARYTPSGDGIVFSRNVKDDTSGKFSYNKDVHAGINAAFMLNTSTGQTMELVAAASSAPNKPASPGGANMPRLSRDGKTLAFVRRDGDNEVLALKDMRSGTVRYVWDQLAYDVSTIPAFMGAYPNYGWTVGDEAIIIWAQGKIWKIPVAFNTLGERVSGGQVELLPFQAAINIALGTTRYSETHLRDHGLANYSREYAFRGLRSDFEGREVVFEAAGDNYIFNTQSASLKSLPKAQGLESCYAPSFVKESKYLLQACWDAKSLTSFHLVDTQSRATVAIEDLPRGRYVSPVSDGIYIAYVRTGKDYMFGDVEETFGDGIWVGRIRIPTNESEIVCVTDLQKVSELTYDAETRLDMVMIAGRRQLVVEGAGSVFNYDIESKHVKKIATGKTSVEMRASLVEQSLVAFRDFQHVWLSTRSLKQDNGADSAIWSKPGDPQTPVDLVRLSEFGGHDVTWSGDGRKVFWLFGAHLNVADVRNVAQICRMASLKSRDDGECARPHVSVQKLNVTYETVLSQQNRISGGKPFAIVNATLVSMSQSLPKLMHNATIVIQRGEIIQVGTASNVCISMDAHILDAQGGAVLPGFVDVHGHWGGFLSPYPQTSWEMETFLGYGVTTIHNPASKNVAGPIERNLIEKGRMYGPRVHVTGDVLYGSVQPPVYTEINSRADARAALLRIKAEGGETSFSVKNYQLSARSARQRLLLEAADLDMLVVPEGGWSFDWGLTYFIDGYTSQEHPLPIPELYDDALSLVAASGSSYTPIAVMNYGGIFGQHWIHQTFRIPSDTKLRHYLKHDILESLNEVKQTPNSSYQFFNTTRSTAKLASRGVRTNIGAHGEQPIGYLFHSEMLMMSMGGQAPYEVLKHATIGGATSLGLTSSIGSIEVGKLADLVIYPSGIDTIEKIWDLSMHMKYVMRGGALFDVEGGLMEVWPRQGRRQKWPYFNPGEHK